MLRICTFQYFLSFDVITVIHLLGRYVRQKKICTRLVRETPFIHSAVKSAEIGTVIDLFYKYRRYSVTITLQIEKYSLSFANRPLSRRLDRCDRVIQNEYRDPFGGNVYYVTMQITFLTRKFRNGERNLHCDVVHITTKWVSSLTLDCNGVFAIKAYSVPDAPCQIQF